MKGFKEYTREIAEGRYPTWVKIVVSGIVLKLSKINIQIENEKDPAKQTALLSRQNKLLGLIGGLGIGINTNDQNLISKLKSFGKRY